MYWTAVFMELDVGRSRIGFVASSCRAITDWVGFRSFVVVSERGIRVPTAGIVPAGPTTTLPRGADGHCQPRGDP